MHYLDNASTTRPCREAVEAVEAAMNEFWGNPSSLHSCGISAEKKLENAREAICRALACNKNELFFTSGGTESDNWALFSAADLMRRKGRHIITSAVEHDAILKTCSRLERDGYEITYIKPDRFGVVHTEDVVSALRDDTILVSIMLVNNESGAVMPISEMFRAIKASGSKALLHTDAVQGFLKIPFTARSLGADMISLSSHKVHGIKGCGALYIKSGLKLPPFIYGGGQEAGMRSGTQGTPQIFAFGAAVEAAYESLDADIANIRRIRDLAVTLIKQEIPQAVFIGNQAAPHILSAAIPGCPSQPVLNLLAQNDVFVSAGSACSRGKRSHVLAAMGLEGAVIDSAIRASFSRFSTEDDARALCSALVAAKNRFLK